jgi:hypothetical protein
MLVQPSGVIPLKLVGWIPKAACAVYSSASPTIQSTVLEELLPSTSRPDQSVKMVNTGRSPMGGIILGHLDRDIA